MRPFDQAWQLLKNYNPATPLADFDAEADAIDTAKRYGPNAGDTQENLNVMAQQMADRVNFAAGDKKVPYVDTASELQDAYHEQAASERQHREEMDRDYMRDMERRIDAGEVTPTDIFDEGGNAAAGEGYMSGGRSY